MDETVNIEVNTAEVDKLFAIIPRKLKSELADAFDHISRKFYKEFRAERLQGPPGIQEHTHGIFHRFRRVVITKAVVGDFLFQTGKMIDLHQNQSQTTGTIAKNTIDPMDMEVDMFTMSKVAGKYENGGDISSGSKMLRIPLSDEAKSRTFNNPIQGLRSIKTAKGLFLVEDIGQKKLKFHYILKQSVPVRRQLGFMNKWDSMDGPRTEILNDALNNAIEKS